MKIVGVVLATIVALVLQTTLAHHLARAAAVVDLVLVVVVWVGLAWGPASGLLIGAFGGLLADAALSTGVIGVGSLAKTLVGFVTGVIGTQFVVVHALPRFVVFMAATVLQAAILVGLYVLLDPRQIRPAYGAVASQALGNALLGTLAFQVIEILPGAAARRRLRRRG